MRYLFLAVCFYFCLSCIEEFAPTATETKHTLVVEGQVTDRAEPYVINLSRARDLSNMVPAPELGASVKVIDQQGKEYQFQEKGGGVYISDPARFIGRAGSEYILDIHTSSQAHYQSEPVLLKSVPPIDSVYFQRQIRYTNTDDVTEDGVRILVDSHDPNGQTRFYRFEWVETYEVRPRYPSFWESDLSQRELHIDRCYNTDSSTHILVTSTNHLVDDIVSQFEVAYVSSEGYRLKDLYSVLVRQYAMDERAFAYWGELKKNSETLGTVFDPIPYPVIGNVKNVDDKTEAVLGYFDAGAVAEKRLFINREKLDQIGLTFPRDPCMDELYALQSSDEFNLYVGSWGYLVISINPGITVVPPECGDCRYNGTLQKPEYWPN